MAKIFRYNGGEYGQTRWQDSDREYVSILNDNRRERADINMILLQAEADRIAAEMFNRS